MHYSLHPYSACSTVSKEGRRREEGVLFITFILLLFYSLEGRGRDE